MVFTNDRNQVLDAYYNSNPPLVLPCDNLYEASRWHLTPYGIQETIYWFIKMLVLPGLVCVFIILFYILPTFNNPIFDYINSGLTYVASIFIVAWMRESIRARVNSIRRQDRLTPGPLNNLESVRFRIGFVGDIMMMRGHDLVFHDDVINFFDDVDAIIGNLEGIVTTEGPFLAQQRHEQDTNNDILTQLPRLLSHNVNWLLCLSNNHSIDFGNEAFHNSLMHIQNTPRFDVFGRNDVPNVLVQGLPINITTATEWSNQRTWTCISRYRNTELWSYYRDNRFNIIFPHWGYENERYVRRRIQLDATALLTGQPQVYTRYQTFIRQHLEKEILPDPNRRWDMIFGHHSHVRQPLMRVTENLTDDSGNNFQLNKFVAFSGGNFTSGVTFFRRKKHIYGYILKCEIGPLSGHPNQLAVGNVEWQGTVNCKHRGAARSTRIVRFHDRTYRTYLHYLCSLLIGIGIIILILVLRYIDTIL